MQVKDKNSTGTKLKSNKEKGSGGKRAEFMMLPRNERGKILKTQSEKLYSYYVNDEEWKEFQSLDVKDE